MRIIKPHSDSVLILVNIPQLLTCLGETREFIKKEKEKEITLELKDNSMLNDEIKILLQIPKVIPNLFILIMTRTALDLGLNLTTFLLDLILPEVLMFLILRLFLGRCSRLTLGA